jgi:hypothetical protein
MTSFAWYPILALASREQTHLVWGRFDNQAGGLNPYHISIAIIVIALVALAAIVWQVMQRRAKQTFSCDSSPKLFRELCKAHRLTSAGRHLLKGLAEARGMANPTLLFVEPHQFAVDNLPADLKPRAKELRRLERILFG